MVKSFFLRSPENVTIYRPARKMALCARILHGTRKRGKSRLLSEMPVKRKYALFTAMFERFPGLHGTGTGTRDATGTAIRARA
jgi:hypothetical protein